MAKKEGPLLGADGDHIDVYIGPHTRSDKVFIVNQIDADTKKFDEHKVMVGFRNLQHAIESYCKAFSDGKGHERVGSIISTNMQDFKQWLNNENTKKPFKSAA